jgi:MFS family permease
MLAVAVALIPLGTAFTFPCVTALLSRVIKPTERGLYMGMQQTYGGVSRIIAPLFFGWAFDKLSISAPYFFSAAFLLATLSLGFGLDKYARPVAVAAPEPVTEEAEVPGVENETAEVVSQTKLVSNDASAS